MHDRHMWLTSEIDVWLIREQPILLAGVTVASLSIGECQGLTCDHCGSRVDPTTLKCPNCAAPKVTGQMEGAIVLCGWLPWGGILASMQNGETLEIHRVAWGRRDVYDVRCLVARLTGLELVGTRLPGMSTNRGAAERAVEIRSKFRGQVRWFFADEDA